MNMCGKILVLLLLFSPLLLADDNAGWSVTVKGLRGRLIIPAEQHSNGDPFLRVQLELQNTLNVLGGRQIRSVDNCIVPKVTDESGKVLLNANEPYDGMSANPDTLIMPYDSRLRFAINQHGLGVPPGTRQIIDFGPMHCWIIPPADGHTYFLSGTLSIPPKPGDHPLMAWSGILELPRVPIPKS